MIRYLKKAKTSSLKGRALVRLDFNTKDSWRLKTALPTLKHLEKYAASIIIVSHKGRPHGVRVKNGEAKGADAEKFSLKDDAATLSELLRRDVIFLPHFRFREVRAAVQAAPRGSIFLLENIRFLHGEGTPRPELARELASLADYYVNDAFAVDHHPADSVNQIEKFLPAYAGFRLQEEIGLLGRIMNRPEHPLVVVIGGAKAKDKLQAIRNFEKKADIFLLGGAAANTVLKLRGVDVGRSLVDEDPASLAMLRRLSKSNRVAVPADWRKEGGRILDIGPRTEKEYARILARARTILWAGPMGLIEKSKFAGGNLAVARAIAKNRKAFSVTGGGETVSFLEEHGLDRKFSFISTGGGAMLEFLAGKKLPGIEALRSSKKSKAK